MEGAEERATWSERSISRRLVLTAGLAAAGGLVADCAPGGRRRAGITVPSNTLPSTSAPPSTATIPTTTVPNPAAIGANELGVVPVLMHHRVSERVDSEYDMTPEYFLAELDRLYREGYYPVRTLDLVRGQLSHVPAGRTPVVLTFDDGTPGQFAYTASGAVNPESGVGILQAFSAAHPDFPATATFYINRRPFGTTTSAQTTQALSDLVNHGFEIGNHTFDHVLLSHLPDDRVQDEFARLAQLVTSSVPGLTPRTMSLPFGAEPHLHTLAQAGTSAGLSYVNEGVVMVGDNPSKSPFHQAFRPLVIPRIRSSSYKGGTGPNLAAYWLDYLAAHPTLKYRSAANPGHVTFPRALLNDLQPAYQAQAVAY